MPARGGVLAALVAAALAIAACTHPSHGGSRTRVANERFTW